MSVDVNVAPLALPPFVTEERKGGKMSLASVGPGIVQGPTKRIQALRWSRLAFSYIDEGARQSSAKVARNKINFYVNRR